MEPNKDNQYNVPGSGMQQPGMPQGAGMWQSGMAPQGAGMWQSGMSPQGTPMQPASGQDVMAQQIKDGKKRYNFVLLMYVVFAVVVNGLQILMQILLDGRFGDQEWYTWSLIAVPIYLVGFPLLALLLKRMPAMKPEKHGMKFWQFLLAVLLGCGICGVGSVIGILVSTPILLPFGKSINDANALSDLLTETSPFLRILVVGILAPIFEELIFRKLLIDHVVKYGEWVAVFLSGLMFGMYHGNFQQFFYAMGLGLLFAYIYVRTGRIWYTMLLHMVVNLSSSAVTMWLLGLVDLDKIEEMSEAMQTSPETFHLADYQEYLLGFGLYMGWMCILFLCCMAGVVLLILSLCRKKFYFRHIIGELPKGIRFQAALLNPGFIIYSVIILLMFISYYVSVILS